MNSLLLIFFYFLPVLPSAPEVPFAVEITNVKKAKGKLWIAIFKPEEKFGENVQPGIYKIVEVKMAANQTANFNLVPGKYALAVFHDLNGNSVLDKTSLGFPKSLMASAMISGLNFHHRHFLTAHLRYPALHRK